VGNNPLKYIDPTGHVKVYPMDGSAPHKLDVLSPIEGTYRNDNLFYFPESYERLEEIVRMYPANKLDILNTNTTFIIRSEDSKGALKIRARFSSSSTSEFIEAILRLKVLAILKEDLPLSLPLAKLR
jgi:hypothetical protein